MIKKLKFFLICFPVFMNSCQNSDRQIVLTPSELAMQAKDGHSDNDIDDDKPFKRILIERNCNDNKDNDFDGLTDCHDPDCSMLPECLQNNAIESNCFDGIDNNHDGQTDCFDPSCDKQYQCHIKNHICRPNPCQRTTYCSSDQMILFTRQLICQEKDSKPTCGPDYVVSKQVDCSLNKMVCLSDKCSYKPETIINEKGEINRGYIESLIVTHINSRNKLLHLQQKPGSPIIIISNFKNFPSSDNPGLEIGDLVDLKFSHAEIVDNTILLENNHSTITLKKPGSGQIDQKFVTDLRPNSSAQITQEQNGRIFSLQAILSHPLDKLHQVWLAFYGDSYPIIIHFPALQYLTNLPEELQEITIINSANIYQKNVPHFYPSLNEFTLGPKHNDDNICSYFEKIKPAFKHQPAYQNSPAAVWLEPMPLLQNYQIIIQDTNGQILEESPILPREQTFWQSKISLNASYKITLKAKRATCPDNIFSSAEYSPQDDINGCPDSSLFISRIWSDKCKFYPLQAIQLFNSCAKTQNINGWQIRFGDAERIGLEWPEENAVIIRDGTSLTRGDTFLIGQIPHSSPFYQQDDKTHQDSEITLFGKKAIALFKPNGTLVDIYGSAFNWDEGSPFWYYKNRILIRQPGHQGRFEFVKPENFEEEWQSNFIKCRDKEKIWPNMLSHKFRVTSQSEIPLSK